MAVAPPTESCIVITEPNPRARLRLLCFPFAGGSAAAFRTWPARLPRDLEIVAIEYPGRGRRFGSRPIAKIEPLVASLLAETQPLLREPYVLYGHSMGALVAFEMARALSQSRSQLAPSALVVSGQLSPARARSERARHELPRPEFLAELRRMNGTPPEIFAERELLDLFEPILRADFAVCDTYQPPAEMPALACPVVAYGGISDPEVPIDGIAHWSESTRGPFAAHAMAGDHFFIRASEAAFLASLSGEIDKLGRAI